MDQKRNQSGVLAAVQALAARQWGVVALAQILQAGLTYEDVRGMVVRGQLHPLHRGVYAYGRREIPSNGRLLAAQLACGPSAYLTRRTALGHHRVSGLYLGRIEVTVVGGVVRRRKPPIAVHRTAAQPHRTELRHEGTLRIASVQRALLELAPEETSERLGDLITEAIHKGKLNHDQMRSLLARHPRRPGVGTLTRAYRGYLPRPDGKSGLERSFDRHAVRRPWLPEPQRNVRIEAGGIPWELDRYYADYRLCVELDGRPYHEAHKDMEKDNTKAAKLLALGIVLFRVTDWRWELVPEQVLDELEDALRARGWPGRNLAA